MKKYVKPDLYYESFQLDRNIAACGWDMNQNDIYTCVTYGDNQRGNGGYENNYSSVPLFADSNDQCISPLEVYCYTNGTDDEIRLFMSV